MPDAAFAPYRLAPGALPEEVARAAAALRADPLVAPAQVPLPAALLNRALAAIATGHAAATEGGCRAADGSPAGAAGAPRACLVAPGHRERIAAAIRAALEAGFAGICLDRPDSPLELGLLGAGFCAHCQRDFARRLEREYGDHFRPLDFPAVAREALAQASGAIGFDQLPFGRDFWRGRVDALDAAVRAHARSARDAARTAGRPFQVVAQFEALGPAQLRAAHHVDAAIFPGGIEPGATGIGRARLLRAALGRRPCAAVPGRDAAAGTLVQLAAVAATCGVELSGLEPPGAPGARVSALRGVARALAARGRAPAALTPVTECALLYSAEADLWSGGRHRLAVERAGEALAALHVQAPVFLRAQDVPPKAAIVLADTAALSPQEAKEVLRRLEAGASVLAFGPPGGVDDGGRPLGTFLPAGKASGVRVGEGLLAELPPLVPESGTAARAQAGQLERALTALLGKGRRAAGVVGRNRILAVLHRDESGVEVHLVALDGERAQGTTLFLGVHVAGTARKARFQGADGTDVRITMNPSGYSISTVLPAFEGYAVLSLPG
jgi:hypothetical protein